MKKNPNIELIIIVLLVISIVTIYFDYHYDLGIFFKRHNSIKIKDDKNAKDLDRYIFNTDSIPREAIYLENPDFYIDRFEKILNKWDNKYGHKWEKLVDINKQYFRNEDLIRLSQKKSKDSIELIKRERNKIIVNTNIRELADLPDVDFNQFFEVLDHIQIENDYVLDYVYYYDGLSGIPLLYSRKYNDQPYYNISRLPNWERHLIQYHIQESLERSFIQSVKLDQTPLSYFQLAVLSLYCDHFFRYGPSSYRDEIILTNNRGLEQILESQAMRIKSLLDSSFADQIFEIKNEMMNHNFDPYIVMKDDIVQIVFYYFTNWGGVYRVNWVVSRYYPHKEISFSKQNIITYESGIAF